MTNWAGFSSKANRDVTVLSLASCGAFLNTIFDLIMVAHMARGAAFDSALLGTKIALFRPGCRQHCPSLVTYATILLPTGASSPTVLLPTCSPHSTPTLSSYHHPVLLRYHPVRLISDSRDHPVTRRRYLTYHPLALISDSRDHPVTHRCYLAYHPVPLISDSRDHPVIHWCFLACRCLPSCYPPVLA